MSLNWSLPFSQTSHLTVFPDTPTPPHTPHTLAHSISVASGCGLVVESHPPPPSVKTLLVLHERGESHLVYRDFTNSLFSSSVILHQPASVSFWMVVINVNPWWSGTLTTGSETQKFAFEWGACVAQCSLRTTDIWWLKTQLSLWSQSPFFSSVETPIEQASSECSTKTPWLLDHF